MQYKNILVIRNDKIGDFMLAWPSFALLKKQYPDAKITALVPEYTADLARLCKSIDQVLIDETRQPFFNDVIHMKNIISKQEFDASISLFSQTRTSMALWLSGIKQRIGPATKIAQIFLNQRLRQQRSQSVKPEFDYNIDLIKYYIHLNRDKPSATPQPPYLKFDREEIKTLRDKIKSNHAIPDDYRIVIIHPGTGGSAINLSIDQYANLASNLAALCKIFLIITAGPGELTQAKKLSQKISKISHAIHESRSGIIDFCKYINSVDIFIGGSTGPLHIAGALDIKTVAFYPARRSATALRWKTLNTEKNCLSFQPEKHINDADMNQIDMELASNEIHRRFLN